MKAMELVRDPGNKTPAPHLVKRVLSRCHREGLVLLKAGTFDNVVRLLPPLSISDELLDEGLTILEEAVLSEAG